MKSILENQFIENATRKLPRSKAQRNGLQETDAEILELGLNQPLLALTMDSIAEEIESGLYRDPFLMGWMTVLVNASDLAAVGASPLGILINETLSPAADETFLDRLQQGIAEAAGACSLPVLGGDTNFSAHTELSGCALGVCEKKMCLKRTGCRAGDLLYSSGPLGLGNAFALQQLQNQPLPIVYRPQPRFAQSSILREFASSCMDSSDGLINTLDQLMRLNALGFDITRDSERFLHPDALRLSRSSGLPETAFLAGPHGEFELIFTISPEQNARFLSEAKKINWQPLLLGTATERVGLRLNSEKGLLRMDTAEIRNLFDKHRGDIDGYIQHLVELLKKL